MTHPKDPKYKIGQVVMCNDENDFFVDKIQCIRLAKGGWIYFFVNLNLRKIKEQDIIKIMGEEKGCKKYLITEDEYYSAVQAKEEGHLKLK